MPPASLRALSLLGRLYDHLTATDPNWLVHRDAVASEYVALVKTTRERAVPSEADWVEVREIEGIVGGVEEAVLAQLAVA